MPVKIRCRGCEKVLNAPDAARGKVIKCPKCGTKLKVPAAKEASKPAKVAAPPPESDSDFLVDLDLDKAEAADARVCPFCAVDLEAEDVVCPGCGMNLQTRKLDEKVARKRAMKGPDPSLFYKKAWSDSKDFVFAHKELALRTGWYWTLFSVLTAASFFMAFHYCEKAPPKFFWTCLTAVSFFGIPGWYWMLSMKIVDGTMKRDEKFDRIHFDFFQNVTLGLRVVFWPLVMLLPVWLLIGGLFLMFELGGGANPLLSYGAKIAGAVLLLAPMFVFPLAIIHMTSKYSYKAWVLYELLKVFVRNIGATLYGFLIGLLLAAPFIAIAVALTLVGGGINPFTNPHFTGLNERVVSWAFGLIGESTESWMFTLAIVITNFLMSFVWFAPLLIAAGFPAVFMMRTNGLLGYYNQRSLELVEQMSANTPANFWVRLLAFVVDMMLYPLASFIVTKEKKAVIVAQLLNVVAMAITYYQGPRQAATLVGPVWMIYNLWMYFCVQEATTQRTTIGKDGFGLIVVTDKDKQMSLAKATARFFAGIANIVTLGIGFVMCAFHPEKKALNDLISKTKVVWHGDR